MSEANQQYTPAPPRRVMNGLSRDLFTYGVGLSYLAAGRADDAPLPEDRPQRALPPKPRDDVDPDWWWM